VADQLDIFGNTTVPARPARQRDPLFDAVCQVCKINPHSLTQSGRGMLNRALKELRAVEARPEDVMHRSRAYVERFRHTPTPGALARHWASLEVRPHAARRIEAPEPQNRSQALSKEELVARANAWWAAHHR
jgi:hypothetical protein